MCFGRSLELLCSHSFTKVCCLEVRDYINPLFLCSWGGEGPHAHHKTARKNKRPWPQKDAAVGDSQRSGCSLNVREQERHRTQEAWEADLFSRKVALWLKAANLHKRQLPTWAWTCKGGGWWWMTQLWKVELLALFVIRMPGTLLIQAAFKPLLQGWAHLFIPVWCMCGVCLWVGRCTHPSVYMPRPEQGSECLLPFVLTFLP